MARTRADLRITVRGFFFEEKKFRFRGRLPSVLIGQRHQVQGKVGETVGSVVDWQRTNERYACVEMVITVMMQWQDGHGLFGSF